MMDNLSSSSIYDQTLNDDDSNESTFYTTDSPSLSSRSSSSSSSSTTIREQNNFHEDHDSTDNDSTIWHSFINDNNDENNDNQQYQLLQEKFQSIYQKLIFLQTDFERIEIFEQQLMDLSRQLSDYRLKITGQYSTLMKMFQELSDSIRFGMVNAVPNCYQQQQQSSSLSLQENHSSNTKMCPMDDDNDNDYDRIRYKLRRLPAFVRGYLVRRLLSTGKLKNLRRTIRDTSAILVNFKKNLQTNSDDGRLLVTEQDVLFHRQLCQQLEKSCHEFYRIFFQLSIDKQMQLIRYDREHRLNRSNSITSQYSSSSSNFSSLSSSSTTTTVSRKNKSKKS
uniref:Centriolar coiled-coil protein of 110 kDa-like n=1 Tax=Dermatophagoides pteronyssinus TaxID=6956 RepID=A0A6P6Y2P6_DERPT|nr:centriolar coiled-coil protein of 110 kDa-like [Dermatophagoides pteronyssinus]